MRKYSICISIILKKGANYLWDFWAARGRGCDFQCVIWEMQVEREWMGWKCAKIGFCVVVVSEVSRLLCDLCR